MTTPEKPKEINDFRRNEIVTYLRDRAKIRRADALKLAGGAAWGRCRYEADMLDEAADFIGTNRSK